jgi:hypothetical protein
MQPPSSHHPATIMQFLCFFFLYTCLFVLELVLYIEIRYTFTSRIYALASLYRPLQHERVAPPLPIESPPALTSPRHSSPPQGPNPCVTCRCHCCELLCRHRRRRRRIRCSSPEPVFLIASILSNALPPMSPAERRRIWINSLMKIILSGKRDQIARWRRRRRYFWHRLLT